MQITHNINNCQVTVAITNMVQLNVDAYIVPQFNSSTSFGGVGGAVARAGALEGMQKYDKIVVAHDGSCLFGSTYITPSGGGNSKSLIHAVSVASGKKEEFRTIQRCIYSALKMAEVHGIKTIAAPVLGTGIIGDLTPDQSAKAMFSAVNQYTQSGGTPIEITIAIFGSEQTYNTIAGVLTSKSYVNANHEVGNAERNIARWFTEMERDAIANNNAFNN